MTGRRQSKRWMRQQLWPDGNPSDSPERWRMDQQSSRIHSAVNWPERPVIMIRIRNESFRPLPSIIRYLWHGWAKLLANRFLEHAGTHHDTVHNDVTTERCGHHDPAPATIQRYNNRCRWCWFAIRICSSTIRLCYMIAIFFWWFAPCLFAIRMAPIGYIRCTVSKRHVRGCVSLPLSLTLSFSLYRRALVILSRRWCLLFQRNSIQLCQSYSAKKKKKENRTWIHTSNNAERLGKRSDAFFRIVSFALNFWFLSNYLSLSLSLEHGAYWNIWRLVVLGLVCVLNCRL